MKIEDFNHTIYYEDSEFAPIRKEILKEKQWLRNNYTEENLIIENQVGFSVVWHKSGSLFAAGGLYELNPYLGRHLNRLYSFPEWRCKNTEEIIRNLQIAQAHIIEPLEKIRQFDGYVITMQNRKGRPNKNWWKNWKKNAFIGLKDWKDAEGYIQTCESTRNVCFQNYVFKGELKNAKLITQEEWDKLEP